MAFPDSTWPCGYYDWDVQSFSPEEVAVYWYIGSFQRECQEERKELRSCEFGFAGATWNLFTSFDRQKVRSLFGINVKPHRFSNAVYDCNCEIKFLHDTYLDFMLTQKINFKFCENSHSKVTDFLSNSELHMFLKGGDVIYCTITVKKSSIKEACPEITHSSSSSAEDAHTLNRMLPNYSMSFSDSSWTCGCDRWHLFSYSPEKVGVTWSIRSFLRECREERMELRSYDFGFADTTWNLFTSLDGKEAHSLFGINVKPLRLSEAVFDCYSVITLCHKNHSTIKKIECRFKCGSAESYWAVQNFLSNSELEEFLRHGNRIECIITVKKSSIEKVCPEITHPSSSSAVEAHTQLQPLEKEDEGLSMANFENKVFEDFKNLLLSGEGSYVTLQVRDQQFKAHRSILMARSSFFAAMFQHDTKENATGVVDITLCEPSYFPVLLEFMYCGNTKKLSVENVFSLYKSADKYDLQDLKMKCLQFIRNNLSVDTFCQTLHLSLQHPETILLKLATEFFIRNFKQIIITPEWQTFLSENPIQGNELFVKAARNMKPNRRRKHWSKST